MKSTKTHHRKSKKKFNKINTIIKELANCQKATKDLWKDNPILEEYEELNLI